MLKIISYWSLKGGLENTRPIDEALDEAKAAGYDGIELAIAEKGVLATDTDQATCEKYRKMAEDRGMALQTICSGMTWGCSPTDLDEATRKRAIDLNRKALQRVAWLGADAYLFVPGAVKIPWEPGYGPVPYEQAAQWAREAIKALTPVAEEVDVNLCVENVWNGLFYSPIEFASVIDEVNSPKVGAYFDVGNVLGYHQYPPHWIKFLGQRIKRVHIKDFKTSVGTLEGFCDLLEGDVPWKASMQALREIGYDKTIVAEMVPPTEGVVERTSAAMDKILAM